MATNADMNEVLPERGRHWNIWKVVDRLEGELSDQKHLACQNCQTDTDGKVSDVGRAEGSCHNGDRELHNGDRELRLSVLSTLQLWAHTWAGNKGWEGLLNKRSLQHELDESLVALEQLNQWALKHEESFVAVDVCGGKGVFSMLLQYVASKTWNRSAKHATLERIILLDKAEIDWRHLVASCPLSSVSLVPVTVLKINIRNVDDVVDSLQEAHRPLALTGIHLCKLLSPTLVSIANMLGDQCRYMCLAPCCMPRVIASSTLDATKRLVCVSLYETPNQRRHRLALLEQREGALRKNRSKGHCFLCQAPNHWLRQCPLLPGDASEQARLFQKAAVATPCWNCGQANHFKSDCPNPRIELVEPKSIYVDVSQILSATDWLHAYCSLLGGVTQGMTFTVVNGNLTNKQSEQHNNWNRHRKSLFLVAAR